MVSVLQIQSHFPGIASEPEILNSRQNLSSWVLGFYSLFVVAGPDRQIWRFRSMHHAIPMDRQHISKCQLHVGGQDVPSKASESYSYGDKFDSAT